MVIVSNFKFLWLKINNFAYVASGWAGVVEDPESGGGAPFGGGGFKLAGRVLCGGLDGNLDGGLGGKFGWSCLGGAGTTRSGFFNSEGSGTAGLLNGEVEA